MSEAGTVDYGAEARRIVEDVLAIASIDNSDWKLEKNKTNIAVYSHRSLQGGPAESEHIFKVETVLEKSPEIVFAMTSPVKPYRIQWDEMLDKLETVKRVESNVYLVYHVVKPQLKGVISARDSLDVVTIGERDNFYFVAAAGAEHPDYPPVRGRVRGWQFASGFIYHKIPEEPSRCRLTIIFQANLHLNQVTSLVAAMVKPKLMRQMVQNLMKGLDNIEVNSADLDTLFDGKEQLETTKEE